MRHRDVSACENKDRICCATSKFIRLIISVHFTFIQQITFISNSENIPFGKQFVSSTKLEFRWKIAKLFADLIIKIYCAQFSRPRVGDKLFGQNLVVATFPDKSVRLNLNSVKIEALDFYLCSDFNVDDIEAKNRVNHARAFGIEQGPRSWRKWTSKDHVFFTLFFFRDQENTRANVAQLFWEDIPESGFRETFFRILRTNCIQSVVSEITLKVLRVL